METYEGGISFACTNEDDSFAEVTMGNVVPVIQNAARRRMESSRNANDALALGKRSATASLCRMSTMRQSAVDQECLNRRYVLSKYVEFGISTFDDLLFWSVPLPVNATVNEQGEICFGN